MTGRRRGVPIRAAGIAAPLLMAALAFAPGASAATTAGFEVDGDELVVLGDQAQEAIVDRQVIKLTHNSDGSYTVTSSTGISPSADPNLTGCTQGANANTVSCTIAGVNQRDIRILSDAA